MKAQRPASERAPEPGPGVQLGAALFVSVLVLALDLGLGVGALKQLSTYRYVPCEARIVSSEVVSGTEDTYGVAVDYTYLVDGRLFHGTHYAADDRVMSWGDWASRVVERLPPGTQTVAYHAPDVPERAVLRRGLSGGDLVLLLFLVPFNLLAAGIWWGWWGGPPPSGRAKRACAPTSWRDIACGGASDSRARLATKIGSGRQDGCPRRHNTKFVSANRAFRSWRCPCCYRGSTAFSPQ
jgi:hypothetical protein